MIITLLICLFLAVVLPSLPLFCVWCLNLGRPFILAAGMVSLGIVWLITRYVVFVFGIGEGNTNVPIIIGKLLAGCVIVCTFILMSISSQKK